MDCKIGMQSRQCFMEKIRMLLESMYITSDRRFRKRICNERSDKRSDVITIFQKKKKKSATRKKIFWKASRSRKDETNTALLGNILLSHLKFCKIRLSYLMKIHPEICFFSYLIEEQHHKMQFYYLFHNHAHF